ncbi:MAG: hypothetical protein WB615_00905 [Candidatus Tumulicola sp.]
MRHFARAGVALMMSAGLLLYGGAAARADNELAAGTSTFYVLAPGNDASVAALAHKVADTLQALFDRTNGPSTVWVVPRLSWGPNDLGDQCLNDPNLSNPRAPQILGGIILEGTNTFTATDPYFLWAHGWAKVSATAQVVSCQGTGFKKPTITWISGDLSGYGSRNGVRVETVAASLLALNPRDINAVDFAAFALASPNGASPIPPVNDATTTTDALNRVVNQLLNDLSAGCASSNDKVRPMCGKLGLPLSSGSPPAGTTPGTGAATAPPPSPPASTPPK